MCLKSECSLAEGRARTESRKGPASRAPASALDKRRELLAPLRRERLQRLEEAAQVHVGVRGPPACQVYFHQGFRIRKRRSTQGLLDEVGTHDLPGHDLRILP